MTGALRAVAAAGGLALAASFFVPWDDHRAPVRQFMAWTVESDFSAGSAAAASVKAVSPERASRVRLVRMIVQSSILAGVPATVS